MAELRTRRLPGWPLDPLALPVLLALLAATTAFSLGYLWNEDLWWYLASGAVILDTGAIPGRDLFVYSLPEPAAWLTHSWLWTVFLAWLDRTLGLWALPVTAALMTGAITTLLFTRAKLDRFGVINGLLVALVVLASVERFALKAELPGWLLLVAYIFTFERNRPLGFASAIVLALAQWLWSNLHGGWPRRGLGRWTASAPLKALHGLAAACLCLALLAVGVATRASRAQFEVGQSGDHFFSVSPRYTCPGAADYIRAYAPPGPIFNQMEFGGYLIRRLYPERQLFIDGRLLDAALVFEYWGALESREHWENLYERHGFETVVLSNLRQARLPLRAWLTADPA